MRVVYRHCNEPSVFFIGVEFLYWPSDSYLISCLVLVMWRLSWLRHYATSRKVAGSIPHGVIGIFH
jgi:hypothetical protein